MRLAVNRANAFSVTCGGLAALSLACGPAHIGFTAGAH